MKRRLLLGLGALGALGLWASRPADLGRAHTPYFQALNQQLHLSGGGQPALLLDLDRLDANADLLTQRLGATIDLRLASASLAAVGLLDYLARRLKTQRFMVSHHTQLLQLARHFPTADLLLGQPMPVDAALAFYRQAASVGGADPARQVTWLIDSAQRLAQYADLAKALGRPLRIALEIDVGLAQGGFSSPQALGQALQTLAGTAERLQLRGLMGYDAHLAHSPPWTDQLSAFEQASARYRAFADTARNAGSIWPENPLLSGAGSLTYPLHTRQQTPLNEITLGSALLKPGDLDTPLLREHSPALWIASPVLKSLDGHLPYLEAAQGLLQAWNPNRAQAYHLYGDNWPARPVSPAGLEYDGLYGRRADQERLIGSSGTALMTDDWVFLRPTSSKDLLSRFSEIRLVRAGQLVGNWPTLAGS